MSIKFVFFFYINICCSKFSAYQPPPPPTDPWPKVPATKPPPQPDTPDWDEVDAHNISKTSTKVFIFHIILIKTEL